MVVPAGSGAVHVIAVMSEVDGGAVGDDASCGTARDWGRRDARWGAAGDAASGEAKWGEQTARRGHGGWTVTRPLWADGVVEAATVGGRRGESGRDGREWRNVLDDVQADELGSGIGWRGYRLVDVGRPNRYAGPERGVRRDTPGQTPS